MLVYNFCAFALQLPLGTMLDVAAGYTSGRIKKILPLIWTILGVAAVILGVFSQAWILGLGNALFHVGAGVDVIQEDFSRKQGGRLLGVFVSPGAVGLYLGRVLGAAPQSREFLLAAGLLAVFTGCVCLPKREFFGSENWESSKVSNAGVWMGVCCFLVVILRSLTGFYVNFPWKADRVLGWLAVLAVASGKLAGGFCSARYGTGKTVLATLLLASVCFLFGDCWGLGLTALFLFNMSMPVTLYLLAVKMPNMPGFSFGLLTFGLFLGFLPLYAGVNLPFGPALTGMVGSIVSLGILWLCRKEMDHAQVFV